MVVLAAGQWVYLVTIVAEAFVINRPKYLFKGNIPKFCGGDVYSNNNNINNNNNNNNNNNAIYSSSFNVNIFW